ncbi:MAG: segregation and condensation protein A [Gammaproteobacteria bacterium]|nr:segregation and condensation protein A [Gammaproteobacteria bacterium]
MSAEEVSQEERILRMMKKVLTDVAKDTHAKPGFRHPLSDNTVQGIRDCLALISARERELVEARGQTMNKRPRFTDEPQKTVVVPLSSLGRKKDTPAGDNN